MATYADYRAAQRDGYIQFLPHVPQKIYHFTNWANAVLAEFRFDPTKPTSLMYERTPNGYQLVGAMYTAPASSSLEALDARAGDDRDGRRVRLRGRNVQAINLQLDAARLAVRDRDDKDMESDRRISVSVRLPAR